MAKLILTAQVTADGGAVTCRKTKVVDIGSRLNTATLQEQLDEFVRAVFDDLGRAVPDAPKPKKAQPAEDGVMTSSKPKPGGR